MSNKDEPAFPEVIACGPYGNIYRGLPGLTKREEFAKAAMQGMLASSFTVYDEKSLAQDAIKQADALLEELERTTNPGDKDVSTPKTKA